MSGRQSHWLGTAALRLIELLNQRSAFRMVLVVFAMTRVAFYAAALVGSWMLPDADNPAAVDVGARSVIAMHWRWDAVYYYTVATDGYEPGGITAFFPLFPLLVRALSFVLNGFQPPDGLPIQNAEIGTLIAGIVVAHVAALIALYLLFRLVWEETDDTAVAQRAIVYASIYPWAYHYSTPYTEGLYLATSAGAFLAMRHRNWTLAGVLIALASATRVVGIVLVPVLAYELVTAWRRGNLPQAKRFRAAIGLGIAPLGLLSYMGYLWWRIGDPLSFSAVQEDWGRERTFPITTLIRGMNYAMHREWTGSPDVYARGLVHGFFLFAILAILIWSARRWPLSWTLYGGLLVIVVLSSPVRGSYTLHDMGRHLMIFFPIYMTLARWGRVPSVHLAILMLLLPLFSLFAAFYVAWYPA